MPLILMLGSLFLAHIGLMQSELHLVVVMLLSLTVTMFVEFFRKHNLRETMDDVQAFFDGMGTQFANVVTLVVAGEIFAKGLTTIGTVCSAAKFFAPKRIKLCTAATERNTGIAHGANLNASQLISFK